MPTLVTPDGTTLAYSDHEPPAGLAPATPVLLLHGLAGHLGEWDDLTARLLADGHRVVRHDARGHGASTRTPPDMTRAAAVRDVVALMEALALPPAVLLGQSLGGLTALLTAAAHPSRVAALVLVEAGPAGGAPELPGQIAGWLDSWPTPFTSFDQAVAFLGHEAWARGLDWREDGRGHARIDRDTMVAAVAELATADYWEQWSQVTCPTLVIRGEQGTTPPQEATEMRSRAHRATGIRLTVVPDAAHDVHLDRPEALYEAVKAFLPSTGPQGPQADAEPPEHARFAAYLDALARVPAAEEASLVRRVLADEDRTMARSAVVRHLDRRAAAIPRATVADDASWQSWAQAMAEAVREDAFLTTRLAEWTLLRALSAPSRPPSPPAPTHPAPRTVLPATPLPVPSQAAAMATALTAASDWLQRRLVEAPDTSPHVLAFLAEHGRTKKVRTAAARRAP
ncbi:alpha/beta fold hydrolase [Streptomyces sp. NPDC058291]|uniref:alpha/beta fold hydrolase n=1 Tax=Streptomyces sp. NPDC058291 TaxID=3346427 RepID=UPI0036EC025E